jgi:hypothetical protein
MLVPMIHRRGYYPKSASGASGAFKSSGSEDQDSSVQGDPGQTGQDRAPVPVLPTQLDVDQESKRFGGLSGRIKNRSYMMNGDGSDHGPKEAMHGEDTSGLIPVKWNKYVWERRARDGDERKYHVECVYDGWRDDGMVDMCAAIQRIEIKTTACVRPWKAERVSNQGRIVCDECNETPIGKSGMKGDVRPGRDR